MPRRRPSTSCSRKSWPGCVAEFLNFSFGKFKRALANPFQVEDPLGEAIKFLQPLQEFGSNYIDTHLLAFEVYLRKGARCLFGRALVNSRVNTLSFCFDFAMAGKPLLMLQSIKRALKVDPSHPQLHSCLVRLYRFLQDADLLSENAAQPAVAAVLKKETQSLFGECVDGEQLNKEFLERNANSLPHLLQGKLLRRKLVLLQHHSGNEPLLFFSFFPTKCRSLLF